MFARHYQRKVEDLMKELSSKDLIYKVDERVEEENVEEDYGDEKIRDIDLTRAFSNCTSLTQFPPLYLGEGTTVPIDPIRDMDSYEFLKYLHEASPDELESGAITERTLSKITENRQ